MTLITATPTKAMFSNEFQNVQRSNSCDLMRFFSLKTFLIKKIQMGQKKCGFKSKKVCVKRIWPRIFNKKNNEADEGPKTNHHDHPQQMSVEKHNRIMF